MGHVSGIAPLLPPSFLFPVRTSPLTTEVELATPRIRDVRSVELGQKHHGMNSTKTSWIGPPTMRLTVNALG
jgi:hypothetical protein